MTKLNKKTRIKIEPSTRDSISSWLDVLTSMLAVSDSQRLQIRDELEDHLRSRVDDLLIVGKPEHEAIQIAVGELGETAELARLITHAHTRINPRRKIMNAALIAVALGGMSFGGFTFFNGTGAPSATPSNGGAVPVVVPGENRAEEQQAAVDDREPIDLLSVIATVPVNQDVSYYELLKPFADQLGLELDIDALSLGQRGVTPLTVIRLVNVPERTLGRILQAISSSVDVNDWHKYGEDDRIVAQKIDRKLFVSSKRGLKIKLDEYQRQHIETRVYPTPKWIGHTEQNLYNYAESLKGLLKVKYDLNYTSIQTIGGSIVVAAPPEIHYEIVKFMDELENILGQQRDERMREAEIENAKMREASEKREADRQARREGERAKIELDREQLAAKRKADQERAMAESRKSAIELKAQRRQAIERVQAEFNAVRKDLLDTKAKINMVVNEMTKLDNKSIEEASKRALDPDIPIGEELQAQIADLTNTLDLLEFELDEAEERYMFLRTRLIESQYEDVFNIPSLTDAQKDMVVPTMKIVGAGVRAGEYELRSSEDISRMLTAAGALNADPDAVVTLKRRGKTTKLGELRSILSGEIKGFKLFADDEIIISSAGN